MDGESFDHSIQDKQAKVVSETIGDSPRSKDSSRESGSSSDSPKQICVISQVESDKAEFSDTHTDGTKITSSSARRGTSCSSSESSSDDAFEMDESFTNTKSGKDYVSSSESSDKSEVDNNFVLPTSTYEVNNLSNSQKDISPIASPPLQLMDRSGSYDASIVPSSIFETTANPSEWSIASNDSLFSIQIGQPSFSREKALMYGELCLSTELTKSGGLNNQAPSLILQEIGTSENNVAVEEIDTAIKNADVEDLQASTSFGSFRFEGESHLEDNNETETSPETKTSPKTKTSPETKTSAETKSLKSSKSNASIPSHCDNEILPDPPLKKRSRKGYFYSCGWMSHLWPSCKCLSCCSSFSSCWICNRTKCHHPASLILKEEGNGSTNMDVSPQESDKPHETDKPHESDKEESGMTSDSTAIQTKQESEVLSKSKDNNSNWIHSFSCPWKLPSKHCCCC